MASPSSEPSPDTDSHTRLLLEQLHKKCTLPNESELEDINCYICHEPFLTSEIGLRLPCGHLCGASCLIRWINPKSEETRDSCPFCRQPILGGASPGPNNDDSERNQRRTWLRLFDEFRADRSQDAEPSTYFDPWTSWAQQLWIQLCDSLVAGFEESEETELWLYHQLRIVTQVINYVGLYPFTQALSAQGWNLHSWTVYELIDQHLPTARTSYNDLLEHLDILEHLHSGLPWDENSFLVPTEDDYLRVAGYHRRINEARARISNRLHAALEPDEVEANES